MLSGDTRLKAYNYTKYDIGIKLLNGVEFNIKPASFAMITVNDVLFLESTYPNSAFFSKKLLVLVDDNGKEVDVTELGLPARDSGVHQNDEEIIAMLKGSPKKMEQWVSEIEDPIELHAIFEVADKMDISWQKVKILSKYIPEFNEPTEFKDEAE